MSSRAKRIVDEVEFIRKLDATPKVTSSRPNTRCIVCTLPVGTCCHNRNWWFAKDKRQRLSLESTMQQITRKAAQSLVARDPPHIVPLSSETEVVALVKDILEVIDDLPMKRRCEYTPTIASPTILSNDPETTWSFLETRAEGKVPGVDEPGPRGGHTLTAVNATCLVLYGGCILLKAGSPWRFIPYQTALNEWQKVHYYGPEVHILRIDGGGARWRRHDCVSQDSPQPRCGHCAVSDTKSSEMFVFGGRGENGVFFSDTYRLAARGCKWYWERIFEHSPGPSARCYASATTCGERFVLFGGKDAKHCFHDVWVLDPQCGGWSSPFLVGEPPQARYGHCLVSVDSTRAIVFGGVTERTAHNDSLLDSIDAECQLNEAAHELSSRYVEKKGGFGRPICKKMPASLIQTTSHETRRHARNATQGAAAAAHLDAAIQSSLGTLVKFVLADAATACATVTQARSSKLLDMQLGAWRHLPSNWLPPKVSQFAPASTLSLGRVVVATSDEEGVRPLLFEARGGGKWTAPAAKQTLAELRPRLKDIESNKGLLRDERREVRDSARSLGIPHAYKNLRVVAADAKIVDDAALLRDISMVRRPPAARVCAAVAVLGKRVFVHGGWAKSTLCALEERGYMHVLNLESPAEVYARLKAEHCDRLEQARMQRELYDADLAANAATLAAMKLDIMTAARSVECCLLRFEDIRSACPPLTQAPAVRLKQASDRTMWLEWTRVTADARGCRRAISHVLMMRGGFRPLRPSERVLVRCDNASYSAIIKSDNGNGTFDLAYDYGGNERKVPRRRIVHLEVGPWTVVYSGPDAQYEVQSLIPDDILFREPGVQVSCDFQLYTAGTEYGWDHARESVVPTNELSQPSPSCTYNTRNKLLAAN